MDQGIAAIFDGCADPDAVRQALMAQIAPLGFTVCACGAFLPTDQGPLPHFYFQNWPADWIDLYQQKNFVAVDFSVGEARRRLAPFVWSQARAERTLSRAEAELWDTVRDWGWEDGFSVPIHGPGGYFALVTMGGRLPDMTPALRDRLHLLAWHAHERCRQVSAVTPSAVKHGKLTLRELECLRWVASGKTDWEIAQILGLSPLTVKTHVDQARIKLDARTRSQAVARMVLAGLN